MVADMLSLCGIVPLEKRSKVEVRKQGLHYGAYSEKQDKPRSKVSKSKPKWANTGGGKHVGSELNSTHHRMLNKGKLTKEEKDIVRETDEEYKLRGNFKRIFPNANYSLYKNFFTTERPLNAVVDYKICMRKMNREKAMNSQGLPTFNNAFQPTSKGQSRMSNQKPEFRIRKRNESAKVKIGKNSIIKKANSSFKENNHSQIDTVNADEEVPVDVYMNPPQKIPKQGKDFTNQQVISKMQVKYGIRTSLPPNSRSKKRRTVNGMALSSGLKKVYSNKPPEMMEPIIRSGSYKEKPSKVPLKKKFMNHNKLPEIQGGKPLLPKIKS